MVPTYERHYQNIMRGNDAAPRGDPVSEIYNAELTFRPGEMPGRQGINNKLGIMEGLMFVAGMFEQSWIAAVAPKARLELFTKQAAYGPRADGQFDNIEAALRRDPLTRRAVLILARPEEAGSADLPCTLSLAFSIRNKQLRVGVSMRSSDAIYGLPYDVVQFGLVAQVMARVLGVEAASASIHIANAHVYRSTQDLKPDGRGGSFEVKAKLRTWSEAIEWAYSQGLAMSKGLRPEGMIINV